MGPVLIAWMVAVAGAQDVRRVSMVRPAPQDAPLACVTGDVDDLPPDTPGLHVLWTVDGEPLPHDGPVLPAGTVSRGATVSCLVRSDDPAAPVEAARVEPAGATAGRDLTCIPGRFRGAGGRPVRLSWSVAGDPAFLGRLARPGVSLHQGGTTCTIGAWAGAYVAVAADPVTVGDTPPVLGRLVLAPQSPTTDAVLEATVDAYDADGDALRYTWRWTVGGALVEATGPTLDGLLWFDRGDAVTVEVEAYDGVAWSPIASASTVVVDAPPTVPVAKVEATEHGVRCRVTTFPTDADDDEIALAFAWERDQRPYTGATRTTLFAGDTVPFEAAHGDEEWTCTVVARAGGVEVASAPASTVFVTPQVAAGSGHACALRPSGEVVCWGNDTLGNASPPPGRFRQLAVGAWHACALGADDHRAVCWGADNYGQAEAPTGVWRQLSAGAWHTCGIDAARGVRCWGQEADGRTRAPEGRFVQVSAGWSHTCAVRDDGHVVCWGSDASGQASPPPGTYAQVSAGEEHTCAVDATGAVVCWGSNDRGALDTPAGRFVEVSAGALFSCARTADGDVTCWGSGHFGQTEPPAASFEHLGPGVSGMCGWSQTGEVLCWGRDHQGQARPPQF